MFCEERKPFERIDCLLDKTAGDILTHIIELLTSTQPNDFIHLYYTGHGLVDRAHNEFALAAADSTRDKARHWTDVPFRELMYHIKREKKRRLVLLLDCCFAGMAGEDAGAGDVLEPITANAFRTTLKEELSDVKVKMDVSERSLEAEGSGVFVLTATSKLQSAYSPTEGLSYFTSSVIEEMERTLDQRGRLTVQRLYDGLKKAMANTDQSPMLFRLSGIEDRDGTDEIRGHYADDLLVFASPLPYEGSVASFPPVWRKLTRAQAEHLRQLVPVYLLDNQFNLLDWNSAFENVVARQLTLVRQSHAKSFLERLANWPEVQERSLRYFPQPTTEEQARSDETGEIPSVFPRADVERFEFHSDRFGLIVFDKLALPIQDDDGRCRTWAITLNVSFVQKSRPFWHFARGNSVKELHWSQYATVYDGIIGEYPKYNDLIRRLVEAVGECSYCLDLGAATGNATMALLETQATREVTSVDANEDMLCALSRKVKSNKLESRCTIVKADAVTFLNRLAGLLENGVPNARAFEACVMLNVLFVIDQPLECLRAVHRCLERGGVLSLSTPRKGTDVHRLFNNIRNFLVETGRFDQARADWELAYERNKAMASEAERDTVDDIKRYLQDAGFTIEDLEDGVYDDCVVLIRARKQV